MHGNITMAAIGGPILVGRADLSLDCRIYAAELSDFGGIGKVPVEWFSMHIP
jgi:hypothetical protein